MRTQFGGNAPAEVKPHNSGNPWAN